MNNGRFARRSALALASLGAAWMSWTSCGGGAKPRFANVVLISIDTTRADHLGCYGNSKATTPAIDALAGEGVRFKNAMCAAPTTLPSHTALMTGLYPHSHGVPRNQYAVDDGNEMLAEVLHKAGLRTAGFIGALPLATPFNFRQGFDVWDEAFDMLISKDGVDQNQRRAAKVTDAALAWLDKEDPERAFLFVHYFDVHSPYTPPEPFDARFTRPDGPKTSSMEEIALQATAHNRVAVKGAGDHTASVTRGLTRDLIANANGRAIQGDDDLIALYDGELAYVDSEIARLIEGLRKRGMLENSLVIITADHGETFYEHADFYNHGLWVYDTTVHVPLIVRGPGIAPRVVDDPVSLVDVVPTVCDLLGVARPRRVDGASLTALLDNKQFERGPVYCEATQPARDDLEGTGAAWPNATKARCVRKGRWKYVRAPYLDVQQLFDLESDPYEREDLMITDPARAVFVLPAMREALDAFDAQAHPMPMMTAAQRAKDDKERARLKAELARLGYAEGEESQDDKDPAKKKDAKPARGADETKPAGGK